MSDNRMVSTRFGAATLLLLALLTACASQCMAQTRGSLVFQDTFSGPLNRAVWNPFITANSGGSWPWNMQNSQGIPSSAISRPNGVNADYDLPSLVQSGVPGVGLALKDRQGSTANGFTWSGSVICTYPNTHYFDTTGFTFTNAYVEVRAKMPNNIQFGGWPGIWFLAGPGSNGGEIDLVEGGFTKAGVNPAHVMATTLHPVSGPVRQVLTDTGGDLSAGYHTYALAYKSGKFIKCYFDGKLVASWTTDVFTGSYYIILCNTVASPATKGWRSQLSNSTPRSSAMDVKYVKVFALR
jgi:hypothetical protein